MVSKLVLFVSVSARERERGREREREGVRGGGGGGGEEEGRGLEGKWRAFTVGAGTVCLPQGFNTAFSKINCTKQTGVLYSLSTDSSAGI